MMYPRTKEEETLEKLADVEEGGVDKLDVDKQILLFLYTLYGKEYFDVGYQDGKQNYTHRSRNIPKNRKLFFLGKNRVSWAYVALRSDPRAVHLTILARVLGVRGRPNITPPPTNPPPTPRRPDVPSPSLCCCVRLP